jgi:predicted metalloprotease
MRLVLVALALAGAVACSRNAPPPASEAPPAPKPPAAPGRQPDYVDLSDDLVHAKLSQWDLTFQKEKGCTPDRGRQSARCLELTRILEHGVDEARVRAVIGDVEAALPQILQTWSAAFSRSGRTFAPPTVRYYGVSIPGVFKLQADRPGCELQFENAFYCPPSHEIFYDAIFLARVGEVVRQQNKTNGRYAVIATVAHEMGHAVDGLTGAAAAHVSVGEKIGHREERLADCFAGAIVAALSQQAGGASQAARLIVSATPRAEGQMALYLIGGPVSEDGRHETGPVRADFFAQGFSGGIAGCAPQTVPSTAQP